jgi:hypothetical protein
VYFLASDKVEAIQRLIQQQQTRLHGPERGQRQSLLLPAGKRPRRAMPHLQQSKVRQGRRDLRGNVGGGNP